MKDQCTLLTEDQIQKEITASLKYLSYAAYFSQDNVNRPGFAKFFFAAASEEREHALKLIEYLQMRGRFFDSNIDSAIGNIEIGKLVKNSEKAELLGLKEEVKSTADKNKYLSAGMDSLRMALRMEFAVTSSIRNLITACESEEHKPGETYNDYHVSRITF